MEVKLEINKDAAGDVTGLVLTIAKRDLARMLDEAGTGETVTIKLDGLKPSPASTLADPYRWTATMRDGTVLRRGDRYCLGSPPILSPMNLPLDRIENLILEPEVPGWP